jgi:2-polyprenyl-3-methyl-5-hydroxy-6-metoxy-1,4-benzoquinol methylase
MPWDRDEPHVRLREWAEERDLRGEGARAVVSGCGLGADAEYLAGRGFRTTGFDVADTAVRLARERHPGSTVDYRVADLLALPVEWEQAFDLVVEIFTLQALPDPPRSEAAGAIGRLVAPGGTVLVVALRHTGAEEPDAGPPFALTRAQMESLAGDRLSLVSAEELDGPEWRVEYRR